MVNKKFILAGVLVAAVLVGGALIINSGGAPSGPRLRVFAYDSFVSSFGPGPRLVEAFEKKCQCKVDLVSAGDAGLILQRMELKKDQPPDLVIGLDQLTQFTDEKRFQWKEVDVDHSTWFERFHDWPSRHFIPFDWAPMGFIYRPSRTQPFKDFEGMLDKKWDDRIALQDPRTSTPGMQFLFWVLSHFGEDDGFEYLLKLKRNGLRFAPSWSTSYGLFQKGKADFVFSYATSLLYHRIEEKETDYAFVQFDGLHPMQIELMAIPASCVSCELAESFLRFLLTEEAQSVIASRNYMYPVRHVESFAKLEAFLPKVDTFPADRFEPLAQKQLEILQRWDLLLRK